MWSLLTLLSLAASPPENIVEHIHETNIRLDRTAMTTLAVWSAGNIVGGGVGFVQAEDTQWKAFHATNATWNLANLGIAALGLRSTKRRGDPSWPSLALDLERSRAIYMLNFGLDTGYIMTGMFLRARADHLGDPVRAGIGWSLVVQGAFLATLDLAVMTNKSTLARRVRPWVDAGPDQVAMGVTFR
ncbi:MAG: hypothetical protein GY913_12110 [Proteobacteria bacterium]|nr:hypothetical protein [Pseudomonadota bacterium]